MGYLCFKSRCFSWGLLDGLLRGGWYRYFFFGVGEFSSGDSVGSVRFFFIIVS